MAPTPDPSAHPDVHVGRDGWLFLTGGTNRVLAQYGAPGFPRRDLWRWRGILEGRALRCAGLGARYAHVVAPEKLGIYDHEAEGLSIDASRGPALRLERWLRLSFARKAWIDLVRPFRAQARPAPLYRLTDSHWTFAGGLLAYGVICRHLGVAPRDDIAARRIGDGAAFCGDLGAKLDPPQVEFAESCLFESEARRVHANSVIAAYEAEGRGLDAHIAAHAVFRNDSALADPRRVVLFGDSYAQHTAAPHTASLTPLLADTFREVHMLWSTSVDWRYVADIRPDFVISEIAERFMVEPPQTGFSIDRLAGLALERKAARPG